MARIRRTVQHPLEPMPICVTGRWRNYSSWFGFDPWVDFTSAPVLGHGPGFTESEVEDFTHHRVRGRYPVGGPFDLRRTQETATPVDVSGSGVDATYGTRHWEQTGVIYPIFCGHPVIDQSLPSPGGSACSAYGAEAWDKFKPGNEDFNLSVFIAELRDLPATLMQRASSLRNIGSNYLAFQFGFFPLLRDVNQMLNTFSNLTNRIESIVENNGKPVRRRGTVVDRTYSEGTWSEGPGYHLVFSPMPHFTSERMFQYSCSGSIATRERVWFTATFRTHIPKLPEILSDKAAVNRMKARIMGLNLTPSTIWNALPWSWLIDYFGNVGHVLSNLSTGAVGDVVSTNAYVMRHLVTRASQDSFGCLANDTQLMGTITSVTETKSRVIANPFGFGLSPDLTGRQYAILAALGISRNR